MKLFFARIALKLLLILYLPFILSLVVAIAIGLWVCYASLHIPWYWLIPATLSAALWIFSLLFAAVPAWFRRIEIDLDGVCLTSNQQPRLFDLLDRVCRRLGAPLPDLVIVIPSDGAAVTDCDERDTAGRHCRRRVLYLGAASVRALTAAQFIGLVGHEIAHFAARDTLLGRWAHRVSQSLVTLPLGDDEDERSSLLDWLLALLMLGYGYLHFSLYSYIRRAAEHLADRRAAEISGAAAMRELLIELHLRAHCPELELDHLADGFARRGELPENLYDELHRIRAALPAERIAELECAIFMTTERAFDSHPRLAHRIRALADLDARELEAPQTAEHFFRGWRGIEQRLSRRLMISAVARVSAADRARKRMLRRTLVAR